MLKNDYSSRMLTLIQEMQLDTSKDYEISALEINEDEVLGELGEFDLVLKESLEAHPGMTRAEANQSAARYLLKESAAARWPNTQSTCRYWL